MDNYMYMGTTVRHPTTTTPKVCKGRKSVLNYNRVIKNADNENRIQC